MLIKQIKTTIIVLSAQRGVNTKNYTAGFVGCSLIINVYFLKLDYICIRHSLEGEMGSSQHSSPTTSSPCLDQPISPYPTMPYAFSRTNIYLKRQSQTNFKAKRVKCKKIKIKLKKDEPTT